MVDGMMPTPPGLSHVRTTSFRRRCTLDDDHLRELQQLDLTSAQNNPLEDSDDEDVDATAANDASFVANGLSIVGVSIGRQQSLLASSAVPIIDNTSAVQDLNPSKDVRGAFENDFRTDGNSSLKLGIHGYQSGTDTLTRSSSPGKSDTPIRFAAVDGAPPSDDISDTKTVLPGFPRRLIPNALSRINLPSIFSLINPPNQNEHTVQSHDHPFPASNDSMSDAFDHPPLSTLSNSPAPSQEVSDLSDMHSPTRQLSLASSLGDNTRWDHVTGQVNSRFRALRDSWTDSNFKMPSWKTLMSLNFGAPWAEFAHADDHISEHENSMPHQLTHYEEYVKSRDSPSPINAGLLASAKGSSMSPARKMTRSSALEHPHFQKLLKSLTGDVVILGGYRGSILRSAKPPHRQLWVPIKVGLNLRKSNLELGLDWEDELNAEDEIIPSGMLKNIGPIDMSRRLFKRLRASKHAREGRLRVWDYGYDWRLSPHLLSQQLLEVLEDLPCNGPDVPLHQRGAIVIAHSMGGLITRHAVNTRPELFAGVLYAGVPQQCVNILGPLRNGDPVLLSLRVLTAQVNFTIRTTFALLPLDGKCFIDKTTKEPYPLDFFDVRNWEEYCFSPVIARPLPPLSQPQQLSLVTSFINTIPRSPFAKSRQIHAASPDLSSTNKSSSIGNNLSPTNPINDFQAQLGAPQMASGGTDTNESSLSTTVTIPKPAAMVYLIRTLAETKRFKEALAFRPELSASYPPAAVLFGKTIPTVHGCRVRGRDGIKRADAYDDLTFASGDGVVLARAAQLPEGYRSCPGGVVSSDRGHIGLLGDLEAVGKCLNALVMEIERRREGSGPGAIARADLQELVDGTRVAVRPVSLPDVVDGIDRKRNSVVDANATVV